VDDEEKVSDVGEFALIDRIRGIVGSDMAIVGIGDDAAVLDVEGPDYVLASVDMLVDGVHFHRGQLSPAEIGHRALAGALSDLAAMAAALQAGAPLLLLSSTTVYGRPRKPGEQPAECLVGRGIPAPGNRGGLAAGGRARNQSRTLREDGGVRGADIASGVGIHEDHGGFVAHHDFAHLGEQSRAPVRDLLNVGWLAVHGAAAG